MASGGSKKAKRPNRASKSRPKARKADGRSVGKAIPKRGRLVPRSPSKEAARLKKKTHKGVTRPKAKKDGAEARKPSARRVPIATVAKPSSAKRPAPKGATATAVRVAPGTRKGLVKVLTKTAKKAKERAAKVRGDFNPAADWEDLMAMADLDGVRVYTLRGEYHRGEVIQHKVFGLGIVVREVGGGKIQVSFQDGVRLLVTQWKL